MRKIIVFLFLVSLQFFCFEISSSVNNQIIIINNKSDAVTYATYKFNPDFIDQLKKKYDGLKDLKKIDALLEKQNYIEVLNHLWTEKNLRKRKLWLEKKFKEGHSLLFFELGIDSYLENPVLETLQTRTFPYINIGAKRVEIDAECSSDPSVKAAGMCLLMKYMEGLQSLISERYSEEEVFSYIDNTQQIYFTALRELAHKAFKGFILKPSRMPRPDWVFAHGIDALYKRPNTIPSDQFNEIRKNATIQSLESLDKVINQK